MKHLLLSLLIFGFGISGSLGQTIKSLGYNTTNGQVVYSGTNPLVLPNNSIINGSMEVNVIRPIGGGGGIFVNDGIFQDTSGVGGESFNWGTGDLEMGVPISFATTNIVATTRTNLGLGWSALTNTNAATSLLGFTTNGQVVANTGTNVLSFELGNGVVIGGDNGTKLTVNGEGLWFYSDPQAVNVLHIPADDTVQLNGGYWNNPSVRASLGFSTNLNTLWTATNASDARSAIGLGSSNLVYFNQLILSDIAARLIQSGGIGTGTNAGLVIRAQNLTTNAEFYNTNAIFYTPIAWGGGASSANATTTRDNLGLGGGITTNRTFVSYNGTNYTTNTVTISNGIITGWTQ